YPGLRATWGRQRFGRVASRLRSGLRSRTIRPRARESAAFIPGLSMTSSRTTAGRGRLYDDILDTIGDTPCVRVRRLAPEHVRMYVKAELFNPAGSVKD